MQYLYYLRYHDFFTCLFVLLDLQCSPKPRLHSGRRLYNRTQSSAILTIRGSRRMAGTVAADAEASEGKTSADAL